MSLHTEHESRGAVFGAYGEREIVLHYGDPEAEADALRSHAGLIDWSGGTRLRVRQTGARTASDFVEGFLSNTILKRGPNEGCYATLLTHTGKVISDCRAWVQDEDVLLATESAAGAALRGTLAKYGFIDDIEIDDVSDAIGLLGLYGPDASKVWTGATGDALPELAPYTLHDVSLPGGKASIVRSTVLSEAGIDIFAAPEILREVWESLTAADATPVGTQAFHTVRIERGVPWVGFELDDRVLPNAAGLEQAISYTKGCYVGQEAVAKLHYLGKSNITLIGLRLGDAAPPARDTPVVRGEQTVGRITSATHSESLHETIAMAFCKNAVVEEGGDLTVDGAPAAITPLPFVSPA